MARNPVKIRSTKGHNMVCLFCGKSEGTEDTFICSNCMQALLLTSLEELQRVYKIALQKSPHKAEALLNFVGFTITGETMQRKRKVNKKMERSMTRCRRTINR